MIRRQRTELVKGAARPLVLTPEQLRAHLNLDAVDLPDSDAEPFILAAGGAMAGPRGLGRDPWRQTYRITEEILSPKRELLPPVFPIENVVASPGASAVVGRRRDLLLLSEPVCGEVSYVLTAGYLMPGEVAGAWSANTTYTKGVWVRSGNPEDLNHYLAVVSGDSGGTTPAWPEPEATVIDGGVTWEAHIVSELPQELVFAALIIAEHFFDGGLGAPSGVERESHDGVSVSYRGEAAPLPPAAEALMRLYA